MRRFGKMLVWCIFHCLFISSLHAGFSPETCVHTGSTSIPIAQIAARDTVVSCDEQRVSGLATVSHVASETTDHLIQITCDEDVIYADTGQLLYVAYEHTWKRSNQLSVGDQLYCRDGSCATISDLQDVPGTYVVSMITVPSYHTYYVSSRGVLAHNEDGPGAHSSGDQYVAYSDPSSHLVYDADADGETNIVWYLLQHIGLTTLFRGSIALSPFATGCATIGWGGYLLYETISQIRE